MHYFGALWLEKFSPWRGRLFQDGCEYVLSKSVTPPWPVLMRHSGHSRFLDHTPPEHHLDEDAQLRTPLFGVTGRPGEPRAGNTGTAVAHQPHPSITPLAMIDVLPDVLSDVSTDGVCRAQHREQLGAPEAVLFRGESPERPLGTERCRR